MGNVIKEDVCYEIIGAAMKVHRILGIGLSEKIYQEALSIELENRNIQWSREVELNTYYDGRKMKTKYYADFICGDIILELKAVDKIINEHRAQLYNYLRITHKNKGILINFGEKSLHYEVKDLKEMEQRGK